EVEMHAAILVRRVPRNWTGDRYIPHVEHGTFVLMGTHRRRRRSAVTVLFSAAILVLAMFATASAHPSARKLTCKKGQSLITGKKLKPFCMKIAVSKHPASVPTTAHTLLTTGWGLMRPRRKHVRHPKAPSPFFSTRNIALVQGIAAAHPLPVKAR